MAKSRFGLMTAVLAAVLALVGRAPILAADEPKNEVLEKHGLKIVGTLSVLETESEIKSKLTEVRRLSKQLGHSVMQQQGTMSAAEHQQTIQKLTAEIGQMTNQINLANQQMNRLPRYRGMPAGTYAQEQYAELLYYRNQLQAEVYQETQWLNQLKTQQVDPKSKDKIDAEVRDRREAYHQALLDLRKLVDPAREKYDELAKDGDVTKALAAVGKARREKPKLGPSHEFVTTAKLLERLEKAESSTDGEQSQTRPARRSRKASKSTHSSKAADAGANSDDQS